MANLLLPDDPPYREFIQTEANGEILYRAVREILENKSSGEVFWKASLKLKEILEEPQKSDAVDWLATELGMP